MAARAAAAARSSTLCSRLCTARLGSGASSSMRSWCTSPWVCVLVLLVAVLSDGGKPFDDSETTMTSSSSLSQCPATAGAAGVAHQYCREDRQPRVSPPLAATSCLTNLSSASRKLPAPTVAGWDAAVAYGCSVAASCMPAAELALAASRALYCGSCCTASAVHTSTANLSSSSAPGRPNCSTGTPFSSRAGGSWGLLTHSTIGRLESSTSPASVLMKPLSSSTRMSASSNTIMVMADDWWTG
mmetsp:Transcript_33472/g.74058  ORF Transcript_33472/g.74058 Transcript_33472/m.74058 type:complete len:243 (+) Transcript_33472:593-1321(+)